MSRTKASLLLIFVFMARGTSFLFSKTPMSELSPMSVLAVRFIMSFIVLAALFHKKLVEAVLTGQVPGRPNMQYGSPM